MVLIQMILNDGGCIFQIKLTKESIKPMKNQPKIILKYKFNKYSEIFNIKNRKRLNISKKILMFLI